MRTALKLSIWALVLIACAGTGAFIAAHSNPFEPEVQGPTPSALPTPVVAASWNVRMKSNSWHQLVVGGRCRSRWHGTLTVTVSDADLVTGLGQARLRDRLTCAFPNAQIQQKVIRLSVLGTLGSGKLTMKLRETGGKPPGGHDYGGFANTVLRVTLALPARDGIRTVHLRRADATGRGRFESITVFTLACTFGCAGG